MIDIPDSILPRDVTGYILCPKCQKRSADCACPSYEPQSKPERFKAVIRLEKSGRQGKTVTVITGLPRDEAFLCDLARTLKIKTGSGGTHYFMEDGGVVEVQGDQRKVLERIIREKVKK